MRRLRREVESLLAEQLTDHAVDPDTAGLTKGKFNETLDILVQERQHLNRKHPNFDKIRSVSNLMVSDVSFSEKCYYD